MPHILLRQVPASRGIEHVGYLVARFVAVPVTSLREHGIKLCREFFVASHQLYKSGNIVRNIPCVVTRRTLRERVVEGERVSAGHEFAVCVTSVGISRLPVHHVAPVLTAAHQFLIIFLIPEFQGNLRQCIVVESIFQCARRLLVVMKRLGHRVFHRYVAMFQVRFQGATSHSVLIVIERSRTLKSILTQVFICAVKVKSLDTLYSGVGYNHGAVVAYHGGGVAVPAWEYRHPSSLLGLQYQRLHHVAASARINDVQ